jgi:hypothetical protein
MLSTVKLPAPPWITIPQRTGCRAEEGAGLSSVHPAAPVIRTANSTNR